MSVETIDIPLAVAQRAIDALCRAHNFYLQLNALHALLSSNVEIETCPLVRELEISKDEMRQALEAAGIAW